MRTCSLNNKLEIVPGDLEDYTQLACYHYRGDAPTSVKAVFTMRPATPIGSLYRRPVGVIVYGMPVPRAELRNVATGNLFKGLDRQTQLALINRNIRCISRVVIEPRFRGIGVMPLVNPFLEHAGMKVFAPRLRLEHVELIEALSIIGIEENELIDPESVQKKLEALPGLAADFAETRMQRFLKSHGSRRTMPAGIERTRYVLSKLTERPAYHIWFHHTLEVTLP
jgi:hypothetical protein